MKLEELFVREDANQGTIAVKMHKAFPGKVEAAKQELEKQHNAGRPLKTTQEGDYVSIHVPKSNANNKETVARTMSASGAADHHAFGGVHDSSSKVTEGRVKDAMIDLVDRAVDSVQAESGLTYESDKNEFCMAVAKKIISLDTNDLFAGNRAQAYEWVKDYMADL